MLISILFFLLINLIIVLSSILICFLLKIKNKLVFAIATIIVYFSLIIFTTTILGALSILTAKNYILLVIVFFILVLFLFFKKSQNLKNFIILIKKSLKNISFYEKILFCVAILLLIFWMVRLAATPIWDYDSLAYHMPFAAQFIQDGSINNIYFTALSGPLGYYPSNIEIIFASYLLIFNYDSILHIINLFLIICSGFAIIAILRELKISLLTTIFAISTFLTIPVYLFQVGTLKIDNFFTFIFISIVLFLFRYYLERKFSDLLLFSLGCGIFIGSRYLAVPYILLPLLLILMIFIIDFVKKDKKLVVKNFIFSVLIMLILGGFWYIRNFLATGNPMFPTTISLFGHNIFSGLNDAFSGKGMMIASIFAHADNFTDIKNFLGRYLFETGFLVFVGFIFFVLFLAYIKNNFSKIKDLLFIFVIISIPLYFLYYICSPNSFVHLSQNIRYSLPFLFLCLLGIVYINKKINKEFINKFLVYCFGGCVALNIFLMCLNNQPQNIFGINLNKKIPQREVFYNKLKSTHSGASDLFDAMNWIDNNINDNAKIGYSGFHLHYPLFGKNMKREIDYIATSKCFDCNYYDFKFSAGNIFINSDYNLWLSNINYYNKEYYVFYNQFGYPDPEKQWLKQHPDIFKLLYQSGNVAVYKIN